MDTASVVFFSGQGIEDQFCNLKSISGNLRMSQCNVDMPGQAFVFQ